KPLIRLNPVGLAAHTGLVAQPHQELRPRESLFGRFSKPPVRWPVVMRDALTIEVRRSDRVLRPRESLLGRFSIPLVRVRVTLRDSPANFVRGCQFELCFGKPLL